MIAGAAVRMERSVGRAALAVGLRDGRPVPRDIAQGGSARVMLPRSGAGFREAVFLNTSGGLASGERLEFAMALEAGVAFTCSTQTAERALSGHGRGGAGAGGRHGGGGRAAGLAAAGDDPLRRGPCRPRDRGGSGAGGQAFFCARRCAVLGRRAMGEDPRRARLADRRMVRVAGRPLWAEQLRLDAGVLAEAGGAAVLGGAPAFAVLALCGRGPRRPRRRLRPCRAGGGVQAAAAGWNGRLVVRLVAADPWQLKMHLGRIVARLTGAAVPRTWNLPATGEGVAADEPDPARA